MGGINGHPLGGPNGPGGQHDSNQDPSSTIGRSYYTSASLPQPSKQVEMPGRNLRSPVPSSSLPGSLQNSPLQHITGTPAKDPMSSSANISSLASGIAQTHITSRAVASPSKLPTSSITSQQNSIVGSSISSSTTPPSLPISISGNNGAGGGNFGGGPSSISSLSYSGTSLGGAVSSAAVGGSTTNKQQQLGSDLYTTSPGSMLHHNIQQQQPSNSVASSSVSSLSAAASATNAASKSISQSSVSKAAPPNLTLGVPPILPSQYGIPMGPGLMTAYTPEALYGYTDPLQMAVQQSRVVNPVPNYYDMPFQSTANPTATTSNRETNSSAGGIQSTKFGRTEPSSPSSVIGMMNSGLAQPPVPSGQHNPQMKVSQQTASHQGGHFMNLPAAAAYPGYSGLYYNTFAQYPPILVPQNAKHSVNVTSAFQPHNPGFASAYSSTANVNASSTNNSLHNMQVQDQSFGKNHVTLTAAMAAANNTGGNTGGPPGGISPYTQTYMPMLPTHPSSQIHLHQLQQQQQHGGDLGGVGGPQ